MLDDLRGPALEAIDQAEPAELLSYPTSGTLLQHLLTRLFVIAYPGPARSSTSTSRTSTYPSCGRLALVRTTPDPAVLYPDVAARGSLAAALQALGAEQGLTLAVTATESDPLRHALVPSATPGREELVVGAWHFERRWSITGAGTGNGSGRSKLLIQGDTQDLGAVARAAQAWRDGVPLPEIDRMVSFVELTGRYEVPDDSPAHLVASEWGYMLKDAQDADWPEYLALIKAAHAEPDLRQLYPYTSHWSLRFSAPARPAFADPVCLEASRGGAYTVRAYWMGPVLAKVATAAEAVSIAVRHLRTAPGPAVPGPSEHQNG
ncbi:DUF6193 family natural product biosynthesis protein [Dactylosporangium sp. NPDC049140]|jgi:hypothetical protein|uniref:DUF6193 family natural product biosynthesis protein n=1 Tax=Dactylosporangium sp. NPDC049140 TaxID=3155647 RepID=UPI0033CAB590